MQSTNKEARMATTFKTRCRCKVGNDMNCPYVLPFENLLARLKQAGYLGYYDEIDNARASSLLSECSNCTGRGSFDYFGLTKAGNYRAFWVCKRCKHWIEV